MMILAFKYVLRTEILIFGIPLSKECGIITQHNIAALLFFIIDFVRQTDQRS